MTELTDEQIVACHASAQEKWIAAGFEPKFDRYFAAAVIAAHEAGRKLGDEPDPALIDSMAVRYRHDFGMLPDDHKASIRSQMKQLWEEVIGIGFYRPSPTPSTC